MKAPRTVDLGLFHPPGADLATLLKRGKAAPLLAPLVASLREAAERAAQGGQRVRVGRCLQSDNQAEMGISVRQGWWVGSSIGLRWVPGAPRQCEVRVQPVSAAMFWAIWGALGVGCLFGPVFLFAYRGGRFLQDPEIRFLAGLALGTALAVGFALWLMRSGRLMDGPASRAVTARVEHEVDALLRSR